MTEKEKSSPGGISRREFLKDAGLLVGSTAIGSTVLLAACNSDTETLTKTVTTTEQVGEVTKTNTVTTPGETITVTNTVTGTPDTTAARKIALSVNGREYETEVEPYWTLQEFLHDILGWTSVKDMCAGYGACGSCSVILNNRPVLSCMTLAKECNGAVIETSEYLAEIEHPLVENYIEHHCMQCGYCTPGFIVTAKALLDHNPKPTEADIREALGGNICRCVTYPNHITAVLAAADELETWEPPVVPTRPTGPTVTLPPIEVEIQFDTEKLNIYSVKATRIASSVVITGTVKLVEANIGEKPVQVIAEFYDAGGKLLYTSDPWQENVSDPTIPKYHNFSFTFETSDPAQVDKCIIIGEML